MTRILVVWEDQYFETLGPFVKKRVTARAPVGSTSFPELLFHTAHSNGGFKRYASSTWDNVRPRGLPRNPGPIDHLVCVVDGDKLHNLTAGIAQAPPGDIEAWLVAAEQAWQGDLRGLCQSSPAGTVHGRVLRWSKESLVLAGYDRTAVKERLGIDVQAEKVRAHLAACKPPPTSVSDALFTSTYRKPLQCLTDLDRIQRKLGASSLAKNAPELDDALRDLARDDLSIVAQRVPDIDRFADLIWQLASPQPPEHARALAAPSPGQAAASKKTPRRPPKR
jgi:hypothetical protein